MAKAYGKSSENLSRSVSNVAKRLCTAHIDLECLEQFLSSRLIARVNTGCLVPLVWQEAPAFMAIANIVTDINKVSSIILTLNFWYFTLFSRRVVSNYSDWQPPLTQMSNWAEFPPTD